MADLKSHTQVLIIGGGAMGVSLLYHLTKLGWSDVVLVEKNELTAGSTWHAAGLCTHFAHNLSVQAMRAHSVKLYSSILEEETGNPVSFHQSGALRITRSEDRMAEFRHVQDIGRYSGHQFNILTPDELKEIYPLTTLDGIIGAIHEPYDGYVDPSQATHAMAQGARNGGATIYRNNQVEALEQKPDGPWLVHTQNGTITAEIIVNAAGTWCYEIGRMMGLDLPVVPVLHQYLVTDRIEAVAALDTELPIIRDPEESWYVRQERDGMIIGPYEKAGKIWSPDLVPPEFGMELLPPDLECIEHIVEKAMERIPVLGEAGIKTVVHGPITFTPDANPLIGPAFGLANAWLLTGSSMGVMEGGGAGKFLAEWIVGGEPSMDALAFDPRRFGGYADRGYRIAKAVESFGNQFAVHYPLEEREAGRPALTTPVHDDMGLAGAVFGFAYGWERPNWFAPSPGQASTLSFGRANWFDAVGAECRAVSEDAGIADMSAFSKFQVTGKDAAAFVDTLGANRAPGKDGRIGLTHALTASGGVFSEFTVTRLASDHFYLTCAAAARRQDADLLNGHARNFGSAQVEDVTEARGILALMGPKSRQLLESLTEQDLSAAAFPWLSARVMQVAGVQATALRVSYAGELGWELHVPMAAMKPLYQALIEQGAPLGLRHFGAFALNSMRLEKGYRAWGMDLSTERTPLEAGLERLVKPEARAALRAQRDQPFRMELLELDAEGPDPFALHPVFCADKVAGLVTSGSFGHRTRKKLALAYLQPHNLTEDAPLTVRVLGQTAAAQVLTAAPYDPTNARLRG
ncbi:MAG: FAD-dependent oxidoreductase [Alphaproteobacteria bacterium]|nr:FAD-dependent oxidoreductase [Alphaproteobacteria bacterium]